MDFITNLPLVVEKNAILVVYNRLSKMAHFVVITEKTLAEGLAQLFRDNVWKLYGLLENVISDKGPQFVTNLIKELNKILDIETKLSIAFYSQTDGQIERMNQNLEYYFWFLVDH